MIKGCNEGVAGPGGGRMHVLMMGGWMVGMVVVGLEGRVRSVCGFMLHEGRQNGT